MTATAVLLALALLAAPTVPSRARVQALLSAADPSQSSRADAVAPVVVAVLLGLAAVLGIGGAAGATCGVLLAAGGYVGMRRVSRGPATPPDRLGAAGAYDLLAACLHSGLPVATAVLVVAPSAPPAMAAALRQAGELLRLGADPAAAWAAAAEQEDTEPLARLARRSGRSGASLAGGVAELAELQRAAAEDSAAAGAERAGVLVAGPLGLCFLPAFVCLGVAPVVVGLAGPLLQGGLV